MSDKKEKCRHKKTWILAGCVDWCSECGAYRHLGQVGNSNTLKVASVWTRPQPGGADYDKTKRRNEVLMEQRAKRAKQRSRGY